MAVGQLHFLSPLFWWQQWIRWIIKSIATEFVGRKSKCRFFFFRSVWGWIVLLRTKLTGCNEPWTKNQTYVDIKRNVRFCTFANDPKKKKIKQSATTFFVDAFESTFEGKFFFYVSLFRVIWKLLINDVNLTTEQKKKMCVSQLSKWKLLFHIFISNCLCAKSLLGNLNFFFFETEMFWSTPLMLLHAPLKRQKNAPFFKRHLLMKIANERTIWVGFMP